MGLLPAVPAARLRRCTQKQFAGAISQEEDCRSMQKLAMGIELCWILHSAVEVPQRSNGEAGHILELLLGWTHRTVLLLIGELIATGWDDIRGDEVDIGLGEFRA